MKECYTRAEIEVINFDTEDVICTSITPNIKLDENELPIMPGNGQYQNN